MVRGPYKHTPGWFSKAKKRLGSTVRDPVRLRQREAERAYRFSVAPPIAADDSTDFEVEEYRVLHQLWSDNGVCRYWRLIGELGRLPHRHALVGRRRYLAVVQRLCNEGKTRRIAREGELHLLPHGERRLRELCGIKGGNKPIEGQKYVRPYILGYPQNLPWPNV